MGSSEKKTPHNIEELNKIYSESDACDKDIFAEQRSNVLLIAGDHYARKNSNYWNRIRDSRDLTLDQKLRLTKNHIQKVAKTYVNNIISHAPAVTVVPKHEGELANTKAAELNNSVWQDIRSRQDMNARTQQFAKDFIDLGECVAKVFWNPSKGRFLGYQAEMDELGNPVMDDMGQMVESKTPAFSGDVEIERVFSFNLLRDPSANSINESPYLVVRKMVPTAELKAMVGDDEEKLKWITEDQDNTFQIFDNNSQKYKSSKDQSMLREYYFRPCVDYPEGYFYITIEGGILFEGPLPFGIFPIVYAGFDEIQTSARHRSIVKQLRPYQAEINRAASKMAEHQVSLGDDKLLVQSGTKITNGGQLPGVRTLQYSGITPTFLEGRSGAQYLEYMQSQIAELYQVANIPEDSAEKEGQQDPMGQLYTGLRHKKKFSIYGEKFETFLKKLCETVLSVARNYYPDDMVVAAVGKNEAINIAEFKKTDPFYYSIKIEPQGDDVEELIGKQITGQHILQYASQALDKDSIGKIIRQLPFANNEEAFNELTINYDSGTNFILAVDRGERPVPSRYDDAKYMIKRLVFRQRQADYKFLAPEIQQAYDAYVKFYEQVELDNVRQIQAAQADFIPSQGPRVKVDFYVPSQSNPNKVERATLPSDAVEWLIQRLADQGSTQDVLMTMNQQAVADMSQQLNEQNAGGPPVPQGQATTGEPKPPYGMPSIPHGSAAPVKNPGTQGSMSAPNAQGMSAPTSRRM